MLDFVYIVKESDKNEDLKYSLRSIDKFFPNSRVWIIGYKPKWVCNVQYIKVSQNGSKWDNSMKNIITACKCPDISDDFILMNDDFFDIRSEFSINEIANINLGTLDKAINKYNKTASRWGKAFKLVDSLLEKIGVDRPYYNYEAHLPIKINKKKFLEVINLPEVQEFMKTKQVLHKRTLYKNYYRTDESITLKEDVKVLAKEDNSIKKLKICGWLSVADDQVGNAKFRDLNNILKSNFPNKCKYEINAQITQPINKKRPTQTTFGQKRKGFYGF